MIIYGNHCESLLFAQPVRWLIFFLSAMITKIISSNLAFNSASMPAFRQSNEWRADAIQTKAKVIEDNCDTSLDCSMCYLVNVVEINAPFCFIFVSLLM